MSQLELYHSTHSTCAQKVRIVLAEKNLAWTAHHLDLRGFEHLTPEFLALNTAGLVPVLVDAGHVLTESRLINEYLEDAYPAISLVPEDLFARSRMRAWTRYSDEVLTHAIKLPSFAKNIVPDLQRMDAADAAAMISRIPNPDIRARWQRAATRGISADDLGPSIAQLSVMAQRIDEALVQGPWLSGDSYSLADIDVVPFVQRLVRIELFHLVECRPRVADWYARVSSRPAYRSAMPPAGSEGTRPA